jgi:Flp pilus assembly protein TadG
MMLLFDLHGRAMAPKRSLSRHAESSGAPAGPRSFPRLIRALLHSREEGSALVEIALVLPMLLGVLTAICAFGVAFNNELTLTSAVGAGAQYLQLIRTTTTDPCKDTLTAIEGAAPNLTPGSITLSFSLNGTAVSGNTCSGDQSDLVQGEPITVTAKYPCALPIYGTKFSTACQLSAKVTEYEY